MIKTYHNATHLLECSHQIGMRRKRYHMRCHILGETDTGDLKLLVFGERDRAGREGVSSIRYAHKSRVQPMPSEGTTVSDLWGQSRE